MNETTRSESTVSHSVRVLAARVLLLALVAPSAATAAQTGGTHGSPEVEPSPIGPGGGPPWIPPDPFDPYGIPGGEGKTFGRTIAGRFNDDDVLDAALLADDEVLFLSGRDLYLSHETPWTGAIDLDTYPGGGPDGQDAVVFSDASGLHLGWWDFATKAFARTQLDGGAWAGAQLVRATGIRGTVRPDVAGVSADGYTLLVMGVVSESPLAFSPLSGASFTVANPILSFTALEWDGVAPAEWAVLTTNTLRIHDGASNVLRNWATAGAGGSLATLESEYQPYDRLVWLTAPAAAQFVFALDAAHVDPALNVAGILASSIVAGDWDRDGDDDVAIGNQFNQKIFVVDNERSIAAPDAISFPLGGGFEVLPLSDPGASNPGHVANPVIADFDGDGDPDVGTAVQASAEFRIAKNGDVDDDALEPVVLDMSYLVLENSSYGELTIELDRSAGLTAPVTDVRVTLWRQAELGEPSDQSPEDDLIFPIAQWPVQITVQVPESGHYFESVYYFEMRFLERDAQGAVVGSHPASLGGLTLSPLIYEILVMVEGAGPQLGFIPEGYLVFPPGGSGVLAGAYVPDLRVPESTGMNHQ